MKISVITDNKRLFRAFKEIVAEKHADSQFSFFCSPKNTDLLSEFSTEMAAIDLKSCDDSFFDTFDLFISAHCKQIFPDELVDNHRCINIHPGFNPYNRGWFPQVFSIINGLPAGVTIHEMDRLLDHGFIIYQKCVEIFSYDTSETVYKRILDTEIELLREHLSDLIDGNYKSVKAEREGNINYMSDFRKLCELDMDSIGSLRDHINLLRATTYDGYKNAYFMDNGEKIYVSINLSHGGVLSRRFDMRLPSRALGLGVAA